MEIPPPSRYLPHMSGGNITDENANGADGRVCPGPPGRIAYAAELRSLAELKAFRRNRLR